MDTELKLYRGHSEYTWRFVANRYLLSWEKLSSSIKKGTEDSIARAETDVLAKLWGSMGGNGSALLYAFVLHIDHKLPLKECEQFAWDHRDGVPSKDIYSLFERIEDESQG